MKNWNKPNVEELAINRTAENWEEIFGKCDSYRLLDGKGTCKYWNAGQGEMCPYHMNGNGKGYCRLKTSGSNPS